MSKKRTDLDYSKYEHQLKGKMFHLLLEVKDPLTDKIRFASFYDKGQYSGANGNPVFFNGEIFLEALDYDIVYPKVYVRDAVPLLFKYQLQRYKIH